MKTFDDLANQTMKPETRRRAKVKAKGILAGMMVKKLREEAGITQSELAERLGISQPAVARFETHGMSTQMNTVFRVAAALGYKNEVTFSKGKSIKIKETVEIG